MLYKSYQHIERLGTDAVEGILDGTVYVYTKVDGSNCVCWLGDDNALHVGSRRREITPNDDNAGCASYILSEPKYFELVKRHPNCYFFSEWLTRHTIKNYNSDAWKKPYFFDVLEITEDGTRYVPYEEYVPWFEELDIDYIPLVAKLENPTKEDINNVLEEAHFLQEEKGTNEGVIVKNYQYKNKYGRTTWAKVVRQQFKVSHKLKRVIDESNIEQSIVNEFCTPEFVEKEFAKIVNENNGCWNSKLIGKLLGVVWHTFIEEECWNIIKKYKNPKIDFKVLQGLVTIKIKEVKQDVF